MSDCCSNHPVRTNRQAICPANGHYYRSVEFKTLLHQIKKPWQKNIQGDYYFCSDPDCAVVYFNQLGDVFTKDNIRSVHGQQQGAKDEMVCYCFDVSIRDLANEQSKSRIKEYIIEQTRNGLCACAIRNPSGTCCLKDIS